MAGIELAERLRTGNGWRSAAAGVAAVRRLRRRGPSPAVVLLGAFAAGFLLAKMLDSKGHAHPRS